MIQSGLFNKWKNDEWTLDEALFIERNREFSGHNGDIDILSSQETLTYVVYGWMVSAIVFLIEIFWNKATLMLSAPGNPVSVIKN